MPDPLRDLRNAQRKAQDVKNIPRRELGQAKSKGRQLTNMPGRELRQAKNQALNPLYNAQRQAKSVGGQVRGLGINPMPRREYKRQAERRTTTDFAVSALFYPIPLVAFFGGMVADWDTVFTRYHMIQARLLWLVEMILILGLSMLLVPVSIIVGSGLPLILLFPLPLLIWLYAWYLGFMAYGGKLIRIPLLTNFALSRGWIEETQSTQ